MSDTPQIAIDLEELADALPPRYKPLAGKIRRCRDSNSVFTDLLHASNMIGSVRQAHEAANSGTDWAQNAVPALVYSAIILYVRATHSGSDHRARINLAKGFNAAQRAMHTRLVSLRNDALAHYGPGETGEGYAWNEERLVIPIQSPNRNMLMLASRRIGFAPALPNEMASHIAEVIPLAKAEADRRNAELIAALDVAITSDRTLVDLAKQNLIDLKSRFGVNPAAAAIIDREGGGSRTEVIWGPLKRPS